MKRLFLALAFMLAGATMASAQTVIVVRHAEKTADSVDPGLSEAGQARAAELAQALSGAGVTHVFVTPLARTRGTAAPTAQAAGLQSIDVDLGGGVSTHVGRIVEQVRALPQESVVLIVGHSNTVPAIVRGLGGEAAEMTECEYDRLTVLRLRDDGASTVRARYGAATEPCATQ